VSILDIGRLHGAVKLKKPAPLIEQMLAFYV